MNTHKKLTFLLENAIKSILIILINWNGQWRMSVCTQQCCTLHTRTRILTYNTLCWIKTCIESRLLDTVSSLFPFLSFSASSSNYNKILSGGSLKYQCCFFCCHCFVIGTYQQFQRQVKVVKSSFFSLPNFPFRENAREKPTRERDREKEKNVEKMIRKTSISSIFFSSFSKGTDCESVFHS